MPTHLIDNGNLTTVKGSVWRFALNRFDERFFKSIEWSYGTNYAEDSNGNPEIPTSWYPAGTDSSMSDPMYFGIAAPYIVRVQWELLPSSERPTDETDPGEDDPCLNRDFVPVANLGADSGESIIVVYPGLVEIEDAPEIIAKPDEAFLPVMFSFYGLGPEVVITGNLKYQIQMPRDPRPVTHSISKTGRLFNYRPILYSTGVHTTTRFVANPSGFIDGWEVDKQNGSTHSYNFFFDPVVLFFIPDNNGPQVGDRQDVRIFLTVNARPKVAGKATGTEPINTVTLSAENQETRLFIDSRPYLVHYEREGSDQGKLNTVSMCERPDRIQKARTQRVVYVNSNQGIKSKQFSFPPDHNRRLYGSNGYKGEGEFVRTMDFSNESGGIVHLLTELNDTEGITSHSYSHARVDAAQRAAYIFQYYPVNRITPPSVLDGRPVCIVAAGAFLDGVTKIRLHYNDATAMINVNGNTNGQPVVNYAEIAANAKTVVTGAVATVGDMGNASENSGPLNAGAGVVAAIRSHTLNENVTKSSDCGYSVINVVTIADPDGFSRINNNRKLDLVVPNPAESEPPNGTHFIDVSLNYGHGTVVGDLICVSQVYSVYVAQEEDARHFTGINLYKGTFTHALDVESY